jgi:DNA-binding response OmpR family regulator
VIQLSPIAAAMAVLPVVPSPAPAPGTILVVEDEFLVCEMAADALAEEGYRVLTAADADGADAMLTRESVDLLFTDIDLARGTNGLTLARHARRRLPRLPVIYTSGGRDRLSPDEAVAGSVFVAKPYRPSHIAALARRLMRGAGGA